MVTGFPGVNTSREDTIKAFDAITNGEVDDIPEQAFLYCGGLEDVREKARKLQAVG